MNEKRESLWDAETLEKYLDTTEQLARKSASEQNGEHIAENLENIWAGLEEEERFFIEYLYLSEKPTAVAPYEDGLFSGLMSKGLLRTPPGVGTLFMQYLQTTYSVPAAVWNYLRDRPDLFFSHDEKGKRRRLEDLTRHFNGRVDAVLKGPSPETDV
ncbi:hypothetical protein BMS3Bbin10_02928 [bacterium BMS3Bbin10]|nr:hypothetical protein BMS3Bbin10_02928 [bacterium BMS3Bbin10]